ncbi:MAG: tRNA U34 5-methylaminomethyl-2-thiouridine-forming methyltransferase MnmC [Saprospiraceae bacterium]|jgi:tRNA U34 5-methylaminomethyl-2-thiouridine-forming methyltransferase MnmC
MGQDEIYITADGSHSIQSGKYGVGYHSKHGAIDEAYHVFIDAALRFKAVVQKDIRILEIGFGTGLNAFVTYLEAEKRNLNISYTAIEAFPITIEQAKTLNYPSLLNPAQQAFFLDLHEAEWDKSTQIHEQFNIEKRMIKFEAVDFENQFDIIYFDAFAPDAQPELWSEEIMRKMYRALKADGIMTTYCAKGIVKRTMKAVGFTVEALPGPPHKREMTRALKEAAP